MIGSAAVISAETSVARELGRFVVDEDVVRDSGASG